MESRIKLFHQPLHGCRHSLARISLLRASPQLQLKAGRSNFREVKSAECGAAKRRHCVHWAPSTVAAATVALWLAVNAWACPKARALDLLSSTAVQLSSGASVNPKDDGLKIENLLSEAIAYVTELSAPPLPEIPEQPPPADDGKALLKKLSQERDRLRKEAEKEQKERDAKNALKLQLQEQAKLGTAEKRQLEDSLKASQAEALKQVRDEEAAKRQQEIDARKLAETKAKEAEVARVRAETDKKAAERARDQAQRRRDTLVAAAGGAGLGVVLSFASEVFRFLGGPTVIAAILRTPGYVTGKTFQLIEWDVERSPREPDGAMVRVTMPLQLTRSGFRQAVANAYQLEGPKHVKQFAHCFAFSSRVFYNKLEDRAALKDLPDGAVLVWTQVSPSTLQIPSRSDRLPRKTAPGKRPEGAPGRKSRSELKEAQMMDSIRLVCRLSRKELPSLLTTATASVVKQAVPTCKAEAAGDGAEGGASANGNGNGAHAVATATQQSAPAAAHPMLSAAWLLSLEEPAQEPEVQESIADLGRISPQTESEMVAAVVGNDQVVMKLFEWSGEKDVFRFVAYVRAHLIRTSARPLDSSP